MTPEQLVSKWAHVINCHPIPSWTEPATLAYCAEVASRSTVMVEVGSYVGVSAKVMLRANPNLHLWCIDIFTAFEFNEQICAYFLKEEIAAHRCELIKGDSIRGSEMVQHTKGHLDAVWVDDGHLKTDVMRDIGCFLPLVRSGGEIFGHDWEGTNDVAQGVLSMIPRDRLTFPVPRVWSHVKP